LRTFSHHKTSRDHEISRRKRETNTRSQNCQTYQTAKVRSKEQHSSDTQKKIQGSKQEKATRESNKKKQQEKEQEDLDLDEDEDEDDDEND
jgi:hypothetical protein